MCSQHHHKDILVVWVETMVLLRTGKAVLFTPQGGGQRESLKMQYTLKYDSALIHRIRNRILFTLGFLVQSVP